MPDGRASAPRLSTLLSWALVAFAIEVDNGFEQSMPHGPWLASVAMWYSCLQFVPPDGIALAELERLSFGECRLRGRNPGMVRWGYVTVDRERIVRRTAAGTTAAAKWAALPAAVEQRWVERYGEPTMAALRGALERSVDGIDVALPDFVPENAAHGGRLTIERRPRDDTSPGRSDLGALLSKALLAHILEVESESELSPSYAANPLRVLTAGDVATRDLPRLTGVAKETLAVMTRWLSDRGFVRIEGSGAAKRIGITDKGTAAYATFIGARETEDAALRAALEPVVGELDLATSPLAAAIAPPPSGWRARVRTPETLPHHPVVSHRGGYPDGS